VRTARAVWLVDLRMHARWSRTSSSLHIPFILLSAKNCKYSKVLFLDSSTAFLAEISLDAEAFSSSSRKGGSLRAP
jgi:hypothetical protein